jgi:hypothetical protein
MENPIKIDDLGVPPILGNLHMGVLGIYILGDFDPTNCPATLRQAIGGGNPVWWLSNCFDAAYVGNAQSIMFASAADST